MRGVERRRDRRRRDGGASQETQRMEGRVTFVVFISDWPCVTPGAEVWRDGVTDGDVTEDVTGGRNGWWVGGWVETQ